MSDRTVTRTARPEDLAELRQLDRLCFPANDPVRNESLPDEISSGVLANEVLVVDAISSTGARELAAYLHYQTVWRANPSDVFVLGVGVHPRFRGCGVGRRLLAHFCDDVTTHHGERTAAIAMTVSEFNEPMLRVASSCGFRVIEFIPGYYGPGKDRLYLRRVSGNATEVSKHILVPVEAMGHVALLDRRPTDALSEVVDLRHGRCIVVHDVDAVSLED